MLCYKVTIERMAMFGTLWSSSRFCYHHLPSTALTTTSHTVQLELSAHLAGRGIS